MISSGSLKNSLFHLGVVLLPQNLQTATKTTIKKSHENSPVYFIQLSEI
jgi:hypothetical protein